MFIQYRKTQYKVLQCLALSSFCCCCCCCFCCLCCCCCCCAVVVAAPAPVAVVVVNAERKAFEFNERQSCFISVLLLDVPTLSYHVLIKQNMAVPSPALWRNQGNPLNRSATFKGTLCLEIAVFPLILRTNTFGHYVEPKI